MSNQNKWIVAVVILVVAAIIGYAVYSNNKSTQMSSNSNPTSTTTATSTATSTPTTTPVTTKSTKNLSYGDAIKAYPERFQFSSQCEGTPATIATRKGTPIMLDNRNSGEIIIKADTNTFKLPGYSYAVFYPEVLGNLTVTCNGKNSVTLNVEK